PLDEVTLPSACGFTVEAGVVHPSGSLTRLTADLDPATRLTLMPYFSWGNRDQGEMRVWLPAEPGEEGR
ncbi:hypothetical protein, partial [Clostridium tyrobutyricum]|uniref:hypothetical protein n=1 Tax=Clostridium tyrobutyricum TaxID=1519 RepID=UPI001C38701B